MTIESSIIEPNSDGSADTVERNLYYPNEDGTQLDSAIFGRSSQGSVRLEVFKNSITTLIQAM